MILHLLFQIRARSPTTRAPLRSWSTHRILLGPRIAPLLLGAGQQSSQSPPPELPTQELPNNDFPSEPISATPPGERPCERVELSELTPDSFHKTHPEGDWP